MARELRSCRAGWNEVKNAVYGDFKSDADRLAEIRRVLGDNLDHVSPSARWYDVVRYNDSSGVSGTGRVAEVAEFEDGTAVMRWLSDTASTAVYDSLDDLVRIHGHGGSTEVVLRT